MTYIRFERGEVARLFIQVQLIHKGFRLVTRTEHL